MPIHKREKLRSSPVSSRFASSATLLSGPFLPATPSQIVRVPFVRNKEDKPR